MVFGLELQFLAAQLLLELIVGSGLVEGQEDLSTLVVSVAKAAVGVGVVVVVAVVFAVVVEVVLVAEFLCCY
uniref:Secreted protein n=1 Tax=Panstrongylus lignarius TaxID=156445 RepID=A0A224Y0S8_9HEMI